jgi:hypothetical protein
MPVLNLGVVEVPYQHEGERPPPRKTKSGRIHKSDAARAAQDAWAGEFGFGHTQDQPATTVTVAMALEERYHVLETFVEHHTADIGEAVNNSIEGALENLHMGMPMGDPFSEAGQEIASGFRTFLMTAEIETLGVEGVPTQASIDRQSLRFKNKHGNAPRPSFVDTGTYEASMRAWIE